MQAAITEPPAFMRKVHHPFAQRRIVWPFRSIPDHRPLRSCGSARPPLTHLISLLKISDGLSPGGGRHHFFDRRSLSAVLSSMASASRRLSVPFSASRAFSLFASETSIPPNLAFHAYKDAGDMPCLRLSSSTGTPASCSFKIPMIYIFGKTRSFHSSSPFFKAGL